MKSSLRGIGRYDYREISLKEPVKCLQTVTGIPKHSNINKTQATITSARVRKMLTLKHKFNQSNTFPSRTCSRCNDGVLEYCSQVLPNGETRRDPFCTVFGPVLCGRCSLKLKLQKEMTDTKRILGKLAEIESSVKEKALFSLISQNPKESQHDIERKAPRFLTPGSIARNNTPDIRYLYNDLTSDEMYNDKFCQRSLKRTLKVVSYLMEGNDNTRYNELNDTPEVNLSNSEATLPMFENLRSRNNFVSVDINDDADDVDRDVYSHDQWRLDTEELSQRISDVYEERYLPPLYRPNSVSSNESGAVEPSNVTTLFEHNIAPNHYNEATSLIPSSYICKSQNHEHKSYDVCPPLMNVKIQFSRKKMFSKHDSRGHCILPKINSKELK